MTKGRYSVPDLGIGNIFAIFQDLENVEVGVYSPVNFLDKDLINLWRQAQGMVM